MGEEVRAVRVMPAVVLPSLSSPLRPRLVLGNAHPSLAFPPLPSFFCHFPLNTQRTPATALLPSQTQHITAVVSNAASDAGRLRTLSLVPWPDQDVLRDLVALGLECCAHSPSARPTVPVARHRLAALASRLPPAPIRVRRPVAQVRCLRRWGGGGRGRVCESRNIA